MKKNIAFFLSLFLFLFLFFSCNNGDKKEKETTNSTSPFTRSISEMSYGIHNNENIVEYTLSNSAGMRVSIINYGAIVTKIVVPDKNGNMGDVITGYTGLEGFLQKGNPYFGAIVGRYANRIANAKFTLEGKEYTLAANNNGNSLHGGNIGYDKVVWTAQKLTGDSSLKLTHLSKDGEEGYPGNLTVEVTYTLTSDNTLKIDYTATTDKATPVNLTSHCYFNLSAGKDSTILGHELQIDANGFTPVNGKLIPLGNIAVVTSTPMDFRRAKTIGKDIQQVGGGYDHNWVLDKMLIDRGDGNAPQKAATLYEPASGRMMDVWTTEPGLQFYSGNFLDGTLTNTKDGKKYVQHGALCLEAQHYPDSPNQPSFPNTILKPGETYKQTTIYKFSVK